VFRAEIDGRPLKFDHAGMFGLNFTIADRETRTRWQQETGEATEGPLKGRRLAVYPFLMTTWKAWRARHPETLALVPLPDLAPIYAREWAARQATAAAGRTGAPSEAQTLVPPDTRLPAFDLVLGIEAGGARRAYPLAVLKQEGVINDQLGGEPVLLVYTAADDTVTMFTRRANARTLTFERRGPSSDLVDVETGSRWNEYGEGLGGALQGASLPVLVAAPQYWWAWAAYGGPTTVYGGRNGSPR
jgi:hypothetical protein